MFQSGHLGASLRRPRDPGGEGLSPWGAPRVTASDKALENRGREGCGLGARPRRGGGRSSEGGSGACGRGGLFPFPPLGKRVGKVVAGVGMLEKQRAPRTDMEGMTKEG